MTVYIVYERNDYTEDYSARVVKIYSTLEKARNFLAKELLDARKRSGFQARGKCTGMGILYEIMVTEKDYGNCHSEMWIDYKEIE